MNSDKANEPVKEYESMSAANDASVEQKESETDKKSDQPDNSAQIP